MQARARPGERGCSARFPARCCDTYTYSIGTTRDDGKLAAPVPHIPYYYYWYGLENYVFKNDRYKPVVLTWTTQGSSDHIAASKLEAEKASFT